jgi:glycosyltransferase involved in cell wall biosynthesis
MTHDLDGLVIVFLAQNEERNLRQTVPAAASWGVPVYVVDGGSSDGSEAVCAAGGAVVLHRAFDHYASQRNWALQHPEISGRWILFLDADEEVTEGFREAVTEALAASEHNGWYVNRRFWFLGRPIQHAGLSPNWVLRLVKRDAARWDLEGMREFAVVDGSVGHLAGHIEHRDRRGVLFWTAKQAWMAGWDAERGEYPVEDTSKHRESSFRRWVRRRIFPAVPPAIQALALFLYRYVIKLGFLDGHAGFSYCMMRELWFPVLVADVSQERAEGVVVEHAQVEKLRNTAFGPGW